MKPVRWPAAVDRHIRTSASEFQCYRPADPAGRTCYNRAKPMQFPCFWNRNWLINPRRQWVGWELVSELGYGEMQKRMKNFPCDFGERDQYEGVARASSGGAQSDRLRSG